MPTEIVLALIGIIGTLLGAFGVSAKLVWDFLQYEFKKKEEDFEKRLKEVTDPIKDSLEHTQRELYVTQQRLIEAQKESVLRGKRIEMLENLLLTTADAITDLGLDNIPNHKAVDLAAEIKTILLTKRQNALKNLFQDEGV